MFGTLATLAKDEKNLEKKSALPHTTKWRSEDWLRRWEVEKGGYREVSKENCPPKERAPSLGAGGGRALDGSSVRDRVQAPPGATWELDHLKSISLHLLPTPGSAPSDYPAGCPWPPTWFNSY